MLSFKLRGHSAFADKLSSIPRAVRGKACEAAAFALMGNTGNTAKGLQYYPKERAGQTYRRTFDLRFGWQAQAWGDKTKIKIVNAVPYAPFVQGDGEQAWMHRGRWRTVSKIISDNKTVIDNAIDREVKRYLQSKGLT